MPELPEVETIRLGLQRYIVGHTIEMIEIRFPRIFVGEVEKVQGAKVQAVRRRGKGLIIDLDNGYSLAAHVKMTGQFIYKKVSNKGKVSNVSKGEGKSLIKNFHPKLSLVGELPYIHTHVIFHLTVIGDKQKVEKATLFYNDIRKFGWIRVVKSSKLKEQSFFKNLGLELPVTYEEGQEYLTQEKFAQIVKTGKLPIKQLLLDQKRIAGIGNIYANDALWKAMIDPRRSANSLKDEEIKNLYAAVLFVLSEGLKHQGASETNFFHVDGRKGEYQNHFLVYGQNGKPCKRCGNLIERIVMGGRGTFVCPKCQH